MKRPKYKIATLDDMWWGLSIGGRHYTGHVWHNYHRYELERWLSLKEAKQYAEEMGFFDFGKRELPRISNKFESLKDLETCALKWCAKYLGPNWLLFDDNYYNPERIIGGKGWATELIEPANELAPVWRKVKNNQRCDTRVYKPVYKVWEENVTKYAVLPDNKAPEIVVEKLKELWEK